MSAGEALLYLLQHDADVTAVVPAEQIFDDEPPLGTAFPRIVVDEISSRIYELIDPRETPRTNIDRVQVTVQCESQLRSEATYTGKSGCRAIQALILNACAGRRGTIGGVIVTSITPDAMGPAIPEPADETWSRSRDFFVWWVEGLDYLIGEEDSTGDIQMESGDTIALSETA